jgi:hypothetical protein
LSGIGPNLSVDVPHFRLETPQFRPEVPDDLGEVSHVLQKRGDNCRETDFDEQLKGALRGSEKEATIIPRRGFRCGSDCTGLFLAARKQKSENSMKLLTWNACRLLAGGMELTLVNLLQATGADIAIITECEIREGSGEFSVVGYKTFAPPPSSQGGKT